MYDGCRFATAYEGKYSDSISEAYVYPSSNYLDDIAWAAAWMYQRTGEQQFLTVSQHISLHTMCVCVCVLRRHEFMHDMHPVSEDVCVCVCVCVSVYCIMHHVILSVRGVSACKQLHL